MFFLFNVILFNAVLQWKIGACGKQWLENVTGNNTIRKLHYNYNKETKKVA